MRYLRRFVLLAAVAVGSAVLAGPAFGARPALPFHLDTPHFTVHYQSDLSDPTTANWAITQTTAGDIAALAERAYNAEVVTDGFPAPLDDSLYSSDSRTDIYVADLSQVSALGLTVPDDPAGLTSPAYIVLDGTTPEVAFSQHVIAHEFFHTIQLATWQPANLSDYWLLEGSAEWMGYRVDGYDTLVRRRTALRPAGYGARLPRPARNEHVRLQRLLGQRLLAVALLRVPHREVRRCIHAGRLCARRCRRCPVAQLHRTQRNLGRSCPPRERRSPTPTTPGRKPT